jgi:hypothetical protein
MAPTMYAHGNKCLKKKKYPPGENKPHTRDSKYNTAKNGFYQQPE